MFKNFLNKSLHQSYMVVGFAVGLIGGMILGLVFRVNYFASPVWIIAVLTVLTLAYFKPKMILIIIVIIAGMILAFFRIATELHGENYIRQFYGQTVEVRGMVQADAETDEKGTKVKLVNLEFGEGHIASGSLYATLRKNKEIRRSDIVVLKGKMSEGFGVYAGYLYQPEVVEIKHPEPGDLVLAIRDWFAERINRLIPDPEVKLGLSYLLGMKGGLPDDLNERLRMVGLVHIVVASGAHLSILVEIAKKIFGKLSRFSGLLFSVLFIVFFMTMVGWTPSILRAGIMSILTILAWYVGRKISPVRMILMVAGFTLMINPMFLINLGWLLSFASFGGIMILGPKFTKFFYGEKKPGFIASTIITTLSATLMTLPITLYYYGMVSLISVVANLLILPTLSIAMGLVFLTGVVSGFPGIEIVVSFLATKLLDFHILVVNFFGEMKSFVIEIPQYQPAVFLIYGLIILLLAISFYRQRKDKVIKLREV